VEEPYQEMEYMENLDEEIKIEGGVVSP